MNGHVPQSIAATVEVEVLMRPANHIVTGQRNGPVNGIVQDGLVAGWILTNHWDDGSVTMVDKGVMMDVFTGADISFERYNDMLCRAERFYPHYVCVDDEGIARITKSSVPGNILASILFPPNFCYTRHVAEGPSDFPEVKIEDGILLPNSAALCKKTIGAKTGSIVHVLWLEYSPEVALQFLSDTQQITDRWLPTHGFSIGISDCMTVSRKEIAREKVEMESKISAILDACPNGVPSAEQEIQIANILNSVMNVGVSLAKSGMAKGDRNGFNITRISGAKGNLSNLVQIIAYVGQQNIKGKRIATNRSSGTRTLPHFSRNDHSAQARGFVEHGYLEGLTPHETFFHSAAGREGVISTSIRSVTGDTPLIIIQKGEARRVLIGEWIDEKMERFPDRVKHYPEDNDLYEMKVRGVYIPTADGKGVSSWGKLTAITRHRPSEYLYSIETRSGRKVTVAESKSLLVWDEELQEFVPRNSPDVKVGDFVPVLSRLPDPPEVYEYIDMARYFPRDEYTHGTDFLTAYEMMKEFNFKPPRGWWGKHNGVEFILPYKYPWQLLRNLKRKDQQVLRPIEHYQRGIIYPTFGSRKNSVMPDKFLLNFKNGFFVGLYIAEGCSRIKEGTVNISNNDPHLQKLVREWFESYSIKHNTNVSVREMGTTTDIRGFSSMWARFFIETCGHGAINKKIPCETYTAPREFVAGLINGYVAGDGCVTDTGKAIVTSSISQRLTQEMSQLVLRFGLFGHLSSNHNLKDHLGPNVKRKYILSIRGKWAIKFGKKIDCEHPRKHQRLQDAKPLRKITIYPDQGDCVKDSIVKIEKISHKESFLYDVTVPETLNFATGEGLVVVDTSDTGYIQKRIIKKIEDFHAETDGTVRDANSNIIQFLYGDDGMDPKKLCYAKGADYPFFINPVNIARRLNSDARRHSLVSDDDEPRSLRKVERELLLSFIQAGPSHIKTEVVELTTRNTRETLSKLLEDTDLKIYECQIPHFCAEVKNIYEKAKIQYGEMVGPLAGSAIGEPTTQLVLNSVEWNTRILLKFENRSYHLPIRIGEWIDQILERNKENIRYYPENRTEYLELTETVQVPTVSEEGKVTWGVITAVTKHLPIGRLIKIVTRSGRSVVATRSKSFLIFSNEKIVPITGEEIKIGDLIPVAIAYPGQSLFRESVYLFPYLPEDAWITDIQAYLSHFERQWNGIPKEKMSKVFRDVILDPVISVEECESDYTFVYDLTVPSTLNFCIHNGLGMADTFHGAGLKGRDASQGVPRFNEILNTTKSDKQKKVSCTVYFDSEELSRLTRRIRKLENIKDSTSEECKDRIKELKHECLQYIHSARYHFEETTVSSFFLDYELKYLPEDVDSEKGLSLISIITYSQYEERWWVSLRKELIVEEVYPTIEPNHWVILLKMNIDEMFRRGVTLEEISSSINSYSEGKYMCIASPLNVGELEVYCNFSEIKPYVQSKLNIPSTDESEERVLLTSDNINFFTCRHIVVDYLKKIPVSGIMGVTKIYPREDLSEKEWVMDVDCGKISAKDVNQRFLNVLTAPEVDPYRTVTDDMHALASILGIEAARKFLIEEMTRILSAEGTYINPRHIALLVDAMTQTGEITSVRRDGIPRDVGPTAKMMFEQAMDNAVQAAAFTEPDSMKSVSSAVMFGMLAKAGTGLVRVKPIDKVPSKPVVPPPSIPPNLEEKSSPSPRSRDSSAEISRRSRSRK